MTSATQIGAWFDAGLAEGKTHLIVVVDTYDHDDYPVFCKGDSDCIAKHRHYSNASMQRVMEVYDLRADKNEQMAERRAMRLPVESKP